MHLLIGYCTNANDTAIHLTVLRSMIYSLQFKTFYGAHKLRQKYTCKSVDRSVSDDDTYVKSKMFVIVKIAINW